MSSARDLSGICNQLYQTRRRQLFTMPLVRYNPESPYPLYSKQQLDMRRKVETLKNKPSSINNLSNSITKKQQLARILSGTANNNNNNICLSDMFLSTPSYMSDVPGPVINLQLDPTVPLYNYNNNTVARIDSLSQYPEVPTDFLWSVNTNYNIPISTGNETPLFSVLISQNATSAYYMFNINIPFAVRIQGNYNGNTSLNYYIASAQLNIYYSDSKVVIGNKNNSYQVSSSDISYNFQLDISNVFIPNNNHSPTNDFSSQQYLGNLIFNNIKLFTQPYYIYDFTITVNIGFKPSTSIQVDPHYPIYTVVNFTNDASMNYSNNCITTVENNNQYYLPFRFST
jgi:hypothetical protein